MYQLVLGEGENSTVPLIQTILTCRSAGSAVPNQGKHINSSHSPRTVPAPLKRPARQDGRQMLIWRALRWGEEFLSSHVQTGALTNAQSLPSCCKAWNTSLADT